MYIYSMNNMEPAPPSAVFAQPMRLGSYADPLNLEPVERETWHGLQYQLSRWQDKTASMGYQSDAEAIAALKAFIAQHFKPDNPDVQYLVRQGLIADTSEPVLAYYGLTRLLGFDEADARDFVATVYAAPVAAQAAAAQETHDVEIIQKDISKATSAAATEQAQATAAANVATAAKAKADVEKSEAAIAASNAAAAAAKKALEEALAARAELDLAKAALAEQVKTANAARAVANQAPIAATPSGTTQGGGVNFGVLAAIAYYLFS